MPKAKTLRQRADQYVERHDAPETKEAARDAFIAGHRANRLTRVERAMVDAVIRWFESEPPPLPPGLFNKINAVRAERAKGRK